MSLVLRLIRGALLWTLPLLAMTAILLTWFYRTSTYRLFDEQLDSTVVALIAFMDVGEGGDIRLEREPVDQRYQQALSGRYWIIGSLNADGAVLPLKTSRSMAGETLHIPVGDAAQILASAGVSVRTAADGPDENEPLRVIAKSVTFDVRGQDPIIILAAADIRPAKDAVQRFALFAAGLMTLLSGGLMMAVLAQVRVGLKPLFDLRDAVVGVREGREMEVSGDYPVEIQPLATELNSLIAHNKDVVRQAKTHVSNLAHGLKTPLAVLQNEVKDAETPLAEIVKRQIQLMRRHVDHHLHRARAAARGQALGVSADISETIGPLIRTVRRIYQAKNIDFSSDITHGIMFRGEKRDLEEMVGNLLDNACKWTDTQIEIGAHIYEDDPSWIRIFVDDDGPGIEPDQYREALRRGTRLDEGAPGTGFGLAIVDDLAQAYKGKVILNRSSIGGLSVSLIVPGRI